LWAFDLEQSIDDDLDENIEEAVNVRGEAH
jgi:hypothetical protein